MTTLQIALLGSFQVALDGQLVTTFESDKARALLAYLAVEADRPHRRESLAALLWPQMPAAAARGNLRHALSNLRHAIYDHNAVPPFFHITRQTIQFNRDSQHSLDAAVFLHPGSSRPSRQEYSEMVANYRGEFLAGLSLPDCTTFEEWVVVKREQCHQRVLSALRRLADQHARRGEYEAALPLLRRRVALEPWDESAHQQLIRLLALTGKRSAALVQYDSCRRILNAELGIAPTTATTTLYERIRDESWPEAIDRLPLPLFLGEETTASPPPFLVNRERELTQLNRYLRQAWTGKIQVAFITGEAGSGKTALMHAFAHEAMARHSNLLVANGKCSAYTGSGDPYQPFREIMQMLTGEVESRWQAGDVSTELARRLWSALPEVVAGLAENGRNLLDRLVSGTALLSRVRSRTRHQLPAQVPWLASLSAWVEKREDAAVSVPQTDLFAQFTGLLTSVARDHLLLLILDDLQWVDMGSLNLLFHLGRHLRRGRILLLGAYRPGDLAQGRDGERHPLTGLVQELQQIFGNNQVDLSRSGGRPFIDGLLDSEPNRLDETFRRQLHRHTGGQALFTVELLRGLQERGDLVLDEEGRWIQSEDLNWDILPARVEAAIAGRIERLPESCRTALTIASIEGETFTAEVVAHVQSTDVQSTIGCLSHDLGRRQRLVNAHSRQRWGAAHISRYRFRHFLFQKYLYNHLDPIERGRLHEAVGQSLEQLYGAQDAALAPLYGRLAWHYQEAGGLTEAIAYRQKAGERAWQLSAAEEAVFHYQRGLALLETMPNSTQRKTTKLTFLINLALPLVALKGFAAPEVRSTYDQIKLFSQQVGSTPQLFSVLGFLGSYYLTSAQYRTSLEIGQRRLLLGEQHKDPLQIALSELGLGANYFQLGKFGQSWEHIEKLLDFYDYRQHQTTYDIDPGVNGQIWAALLLWVRGYPDQACQRRQEAIDLARTIEHPLSLAAALEVAGGIMHILGRNYEAAEDDLKASLQLAVEQKFGSFQAEGAFYRGYCQVAAGKEMAGLAQMEAALDAWLASGMRIFYTLMLGLLAEATGKSGRVEEGLKLVSEGLSVVAEKEEWAFAAELHRIRGDLLLASGADTAAVQSAYQKAIAIARRQGAKSWELRAALHLAQLWQQEGKVTQARSILSDLVNWFHEGFATPDLQAALTITQANSEDLTPP